MVIYSRNDPPMCLIFSSIRKDVALDWFYFLSSHSLHNFEELIEAFPHSVYLSWEAKRNTHNLLTVKMIRGDNLKSYIGYFQSQLAKVPNCGENISMLAFISELQVSYPLYKHLLKHNFTRMSEILSRAQPYIYLKEA